MCVVRMSYLTIYDHDDEEDDRRGQDDVEKGEEERLLQGHAVLLAQAFDVHRVQDVGDGLRAQVGGRRGGRIGGVGRPGKTKQLSKWLSILQLVLIITFYQVL